MSVDIDMRQFARGVGTTMSWPAGSVIFAKGDPGQCMYIVQSGRIDMMIGEDVVETVGPNEAIGFMSMIDDAARSTTARVREPCELSAIDKRQFRFMVDEVPHFSMYLLGVLSRRIRGMGQVIAG